MSICKFVVDFIFLSKNAWKTVGNYTAFFLIFLAVKKPAGEGGLVD